MSPTEKTLAFCLLYICVGLVTVLALVFEIRVRDEAQPEPRELALAALFLWPVVLALLAWLELIEPRLAAWRERRVTKVQRPR